MKETRWGGGAPCGRQAWCRGGPTRSAPHRLEVVAGWPNLGRAASAQRAPKRHWDRRVALETLVNSRRVTGVTGQRATGSQVGGHRRGTVGGGTRVGMLEDGA
jgi:hypothetical protein